MSVKTWYDADGNWIAKATVRRCTPEEAEEHDRAWKPTTWMDAPRDRSKWYVTRFRCAHVAGGPFDTHAEAMALSDRLNGGHRVNGLFVLDSQTG